ncbi:hypothetical protein [Scytonema sp. NUACC26]|uniref:hypothetical protein n=1 Tax=Scytonema sp. NUACC26 TaxID=3140176 RepID=UPI0034DC8ADC
MTNEEYFKELEKLIVLLFCYVQIVEDSTLKWFHHKQNSEQFLTELMDAKVQLAKDCELYVKTIKRLYGVEK